MPETVKNARCIQGCPVIHQYSCIYRRDQRRQMSKKAYKSDRSVFCNFLQSADVYVLRNHSARANVSVVSKVMQYLSVNWKDLSQIMHWKMISNRKNQRRQTDIK